jgi:hypothetical protein
MPICFQVVREFQKARLPRFVNLILLAVLLSVAAASPSLADEVTNFSTNLRILPDTTVDVHEDLTVRFTSPRHGIKRFIPVVYKRNGNNYTIDLKLLGVTSTGGKYVPYKTEKQGRDFFIVIGNPEKTVLGLQQYHIHYTVKRVVNFFDEKPELYWNATGNEWHMPIEKVVARVDFPPVSDKAEIRAKAFIGEEGSNSTAGYTLDLNSATFTSGKLEPGEGLTVVVGLPEGLILKPTQWQEFLYLAADWWPLVVLPLLTFTACFNMWWYVGRDAIKRQAVSVEWEPPKELSPAEVGTLIDEKCDLSDMVSTLIDLAARGYITIREFKTDSLFFFRNKDYEFTRLPESEKQAKTPLNVYERRFLDAMFHWARHDGKKVKLSDLKYRFYIELRSIERDIYKSLIEKGMFLQSPDDVRMSWCCIGAVLIICCFIAGPIQSSFGLGLLLSAIVVLCFARTMPARTRKGCEALNQCLSFQRFVKLAEKERIRKLVTDDPTIFGRLLPYAMVLGAADQWADAFKDLITSPPEWYLSDGPGFHTHSFVRDLGDGTRTMGQTFTSTPSSSAGSGGSGFSGGSSGGGFGGGGGSSW